MKRVAVFGNAGGGKSTLAKSLALRTGLPLHSIDILKYRPGGAEVPHDEYLREHAKLVCQERWIIDGYGCIPSAWERFTSADTLIFVDLSPALHFWWVTKRLIKGLIATPEGWPEGSPMWRSTLNSYRVIRLCNRHLTPKYRKLVSDEAASKRVLHLRSPAEIRNFLRTIKTDCASSSPPNSQFSN